MNDLAVHVRQAAVDAVVPEGQPRVVDAQQMQDRRVQIVAVSLALGCLVTQIVALRRRSRPL